MGIDVASAWTRLRPEKPGQYIASNSIFALGIFLLSLPATLLLVTMPPALVLAACVLAWVAYRFDMWSGLLVGYVATIVMITSVPTSCPTNVACDGPSFFLYWSFTATSWVVQTILTFGIGAGFVRAAGFKITTEPSPGM